MTRLPSGSRSRLNRSPCQNRVGGVERSTSSTKSGPGAHRVLPFRLRRSKTTLTAPAATGGPGVGDGLLVPLEGVGRRDQGAEAGRPPPGRWPGRSCGAGRRRRSRRRSHRGRRPRPRRRRHRPRSARGATAEPGRRDTCPACPTSTTRPRGRTMASAWVSEARSVPTQSKTTSAPLVSRPASTSEPAWRRTARASWSGATTVSAPRHSASWRWWRVLGPDHHRAAGRRGRTTWSEGGHHGQAEGAGPDHRHRVARFHAGRQDGVDGAGGGLDHDGVLVGEGLGHGVELGGVGDQAGGGPAAAGVGAEPGLEAGLEVAEGHVAAQAGVALGALGAERADVAGGATEHRLDDRPGARSAAGVRRGRSRRSSSTPTTSWPGTKGKLTMSSK